MPTNDELQAAREEVEHHKWIYDSHLMDMPVNWVNIAAMVSGITDAQAVYIDALEADHAAQQQRIEELEAWKESAKSVLASHTHVLQDILAPHVLLGDDMETAVGRVLKRIETLMAAYNILHGILVDEIQGYKSGGSPDLSELEEALRRAEALHGGDAKEG